MRHLDKVPCPECGTEVRPWWEGPDETAHVGCSNCGAELVWRVEIYTSVDLGEFLYDDRFSVRCATCPEWIDSRKAGQLNGKPTCPRCIKHPPVALVAS